jgi:predicted DNA-binding transcriptional regulator AlpA
MQFLTSKDVCQKVAVSRATLDRMVASKEFPSPIRLTERRLVYDAAAVEAWMREKVGLEYVPLSQCLLKMGADPKMIALIAKPLDGIS